MPSFFSLYWVSRVWSPVGVLAGLRPSPVLRVGQGPRAQSHREKVKKRADPSTSVLGQEANLLFASWPLPSLLFIVMGYVCCDRKVGEGVVSTEAVFTYP